MTTLTEWLASLVALLTLLLGLLGGCNGMAIPSIDYHPSPGVLASVQPPDAVLAGATAETVLAVGFAVVLLFSIWQWRRGANGK